MYVAVQARQDIAYSAFKLARFFTNFDQTHSKADKKFVKYFNSTKNYALTFGTWDKD